jgi:hypothetical protein
MDKKTELLFLKQELTNNLKKKWQKFVTTAEIAHCITEKIKRSENFQLNDFDIFINKQNIEVNHRKEKFLNFEYKQNPISKIISLK